MLPEFFSSLRFLHIIAGSAALLLFFMPALVKKGGKLHIRDRWMLRGPTSRMHWWYEHLGGMIGTAIATWTAFVVIGGGVFFPGLTRSKGVFIFWIAPSVVGSPPLHFLKRYYRRKFHEDKLPPEHVIEMTPFRPSRQNQATGGLDNA